MNLAVYRTERRSMVTGNNSGDWTPYYVLAYGTLAETNEVLSPVVSLFQIEPAYALADTVSRSATSTT